MMKTFFTTFMVMFVFVTTFVVTSSKAQTFSTLKVGPSTPLNASALLEIQGTTGAFLLPRMTTTQKNAIASPTNGDVVFDTTLSQYSAYLSGSWVQITTGGGAVWGLISGTLSNQTDLQTALNLKAPLASPTFTGTVTAPTFLGALSGNASTATALAAIPSGCSSNQFSNSIAANGNLGCTAINYNQLSGVLPNPSASTLGGVESAAPVTHQWINSISTSGVPALSQPGFGDLSGSLNLASQVGSSLLGVSNGGTGLASGTSGGILAYTSTSLLASSGLLGQNQLMLGGGAGATPSTLGSLGTTTTVLHGNASGAPSFGAVSLSTDVTNTLPIGNGGTNNASLAVTAGGALYTDGTAVQNTGAGLTGQVLTSAAAGAPTWKPPGGASSAINILQNFNWNAELGSTTNWTNSGGTFAVDNTAANVANGTYAFTFTASASSQTVLSNLTAIPAGLYGQRCLLEFYTKGFDANMTAEVTDGTNVIATRVLSAQSLYGVQDMNFICPSSGSLQMKLISTAASAQGWWDQVSLGSAINMTNVSQASLIGQISITGCSWDSTSTTFANYAATTGCTYTVLNGSGVSAPSTQVPAIKFSSLPPGNYRLHLEGRIQAGDAAKSSYFRFSDGTNVANEVSQLQTGASGATIIPGFDQTISYTTAQSNVTLQAQTKIDSGGDSGISANPLVISVYLFPLASQLAINPNIGPSSWSGFHDSTCNWTFTNVGTFIDATGDSTCVFTQQTNVNFGSVTSALSSGNAIPGIVFTPQTTGNYFICAVANSSASVATITGRVQLTDGTTVIAQASYEGPSTSGSAITLCGNYAVTAAGSPITLKLQAGVTATGTFDLGGQTGAPAVGSVYWSVVSTSASLPAPYYAGNVSSNTTGQEHIERLSFGGSTYPSTCAASPCTIYTQSGSWVTSVTRASTGNYTVNFVAGEFSARPTCTAMTYGQTSADFVYSNVAITTSSWNLITTNGTSHDEAVDVICMGPH